MKTIIFILFLLTLASCSDSRYRPIPASELLTDYVTTVPTPAEKLAPGIKPTYEVEVKDESGVQNVTVRFSGTLPAPEVVDKILRNEFEKNVRKNPKSDGFASACTESRVCLTDNDYSGDLFYKATEKKIITSDEANGISFSGKDFGPYFVLTEELSGKLTGMQVLPTPFDQMFILHVVFPQPPTQKVAYKALVAAIEKLRDTHRGVGIEAFAEAGDRDKRTTWYKLKGSDGEPIEAHYNELNDCIYAKLLTVLKQF